MKHLTRVKKLLNQVKRKYGMKDKINIKVVKKDIKDRRAPFMSLFLTKNPFIHIYLKKPPYRFEILADSIIKRNLAHELVHFLCFKYRKEKNPKQLKSVLKTINKMIDCR